MLSFLHRWDYCWKCEFDTDVKMEGNIFSPWWRKVGFYKKVQIKTQGKCKVVLVTFIWQEAKNFYLFDKSCTQENVKYPMNQVDLEES